MIHSLPLITTIATALGLALLMGFISVKLKMPALVGYLLAGVIIGPFTPGFVADTQIAQELAEIGVMLLMFGVGLHFSINDLLDVRHIALPGAIVQITVATILGTGAAMMAWGWPLGSAVVFGLALSVASTVVLLRALEEKNILESINGRIAVGWLIVEDLFMVIVLVLLPPLSQWMGGQDALHADKNLWLILSMTLIKISTFIALMLFFGRKFFPILLGHVARTRSRELFTLCIIAAAVSIAYVAAKLFGASFALGAFFAGMVLQESKFSHRAAQESLPLRDAFAVLFFVAVGMLFDPKIIIEHPAPILIVVAIIVIGKSIAAFVLVLLFRYPLSSACIVSASLAQIGEFSFILAELGVRLGLLPIEGRSYILAGALISIAINPLVFKLIDATQQWAKSCPKLALLFEKITSPLAALPITTNQKYLSGQVILVGYGRLTKQITKHLLNHHTPYIIIDDNLDVVEHLRENHIAAVSGDATDPLVLMQAHIARASMLVITISNTFTIPLIVECARKLNKDIHIMVRANYQDDALILKKDKKLKVFFTEEEMAKTIADYILEQ